MIRISKTHIIHALLIGILAILLCVVTACSNNKQENQVKNSEFHSLLDESELVNKDSLTVANSPNYPPYEYEEEGTIKGFDVDLADMIANELGLKCQLVPYVYNEYFVQDAQQGEKFDVAISAFVKSEARSKNINFSTPYLSSVNKLNLIVKKGSDINDSNWEQSIKQDTKVGVGETSSFRYYLMDNFPNANLVPVKDYAALIKSLNSGETTIGVSDDGIFDKIEDKDSYKVVKTFDITEEIAVGISKAKPKLLDAINKIIDKFSNDGTLDNLRKKYNID